MPRHTPDFARHPAPHGPTGPTGMTSAPRLRWTRSLMVRGAVGLVAAFALAAALRAYATGRAPLGEAFSLTLIALAAVGALTRRYGIPLPGNGFSSYVLGVVAFAARDRGWPFAVLAAPVGMAVGDVFLRRLPLRAALGNAAHLAAGTAIVGFLYDRLGGAHGTGALAAGNIGSLVVFVVLLPVVINGSFYLELATGRTIAWVDARLTLRWETVVYGVSAALALAWLAFVHASLPAGATALVAAVLIGATAGSVAVIRLGVRADELRLIQGLAQAIAADINLAHSFPHIQELTRRLVPWEQIGFARYDPRTREMELVVDTAMTGGVAQQKLRFEAEGGLTGEALRLRRPIVAHALRRDQVIVPGAETPGSEILVPLFHAGTLVGLWSVRHSDPAMYRDSDGALLELLAPQLALMLALESTVQPIIGASDQTATYVETLTATTEEIHASSQEVAASAQRASTGAAQAAGLVR